MYADAHMGGFDKLILVEPAPHLVSFLKDKYRSHIATRKVIIVDKVVSDEKKVTLYLCNVDTVTTASSAWMNDSRFADKGFEWTPTTDLPVTTLDAIIKEHGGSTGLTKTKIDVEGYESHVIKSLSTYVGPLSFQWAEEVRDDVIRCIYHLTTKLGYTKFHIQHQDKYDYDPPISQYTTLDQIIVVLDLWQPKRKDAWGMIHCL
jgi:FkbM family methyltransferase